MSSPLISVIKFEFVRQVKKPSFWASILLIPILMFGIFAISFWSSKSSQPTSELDENTVVAITDEAGALPEEVPFVTVNNREEGIEKVKSGEVKLYFYIPADFAESKKVDFYHVSEGLDVFNADSQAIKFILKQVASMRVDELDVVALTGDFEVKDNKLAVTGEESNALGKAIIPGAFLLIFFLFVCLFGNRLLMAVVEEKENRISEMILTSVSAKHLIVGKIIAMMMLGVIQILTFVIPAVIALLIYRDNPVVGEIISSIEITPLSIITTLLLFILSILIVVGSCTYIGTLSPTAKDASQFIAPVIIGIVFPLYFMQAFFAPEPSTVVYFLTYFPLSAPIALLLRTVFGTLTTPELIIGIIELAVIAFVIIRMAVRSFQRNAINFEVALPKLLKGRKG